MKRIYHNYNLWEDFKNGFYDNCKNELKESKIRSVIDMFSSEELTYEYMNRVIDEWVYSCEHNFTNDSINKIAYIGQAACCIYDKVPNLITMYAWKFLSYDIQKRSDLIALETIKKWEQNQTLKNILNNGSQKGMKMESQMKLHFN